MSRLPVDSTSQLAGHCEKRAFSTWHVPVVQHVAPPQTARRNTITAWREARLDWWTRAQTDVVNVDKLDELPDAGFVGLALELDGERFDVGPPPPTVLEAPARDPVSQRSQSSCRRSGRRRRLGRSAVAGPRSSWRERAGAGGT